MSVTGVSGAFSSPFRGNYSGCVAWRQRGPQAQLVGNTTQVAVNLFAVTPTFPPASPHQWRDRNQTNRDLLTACVSGMEDKRSPAMFSLCLLYRCENKETKPGAGLLAGCFIGFKTGGTQDKWPLTCMSLPFLLLQVLYSNTPEGGLWSYNAFSQTGKHIKL